MINFFKKNKKFKEGFSLVEMIIVVAIFIIISAVILSKQSKFSSDILLSNVAYQVALSIREAQVLGIGAMQIDPDDTGVALSYQDFGYGIHVSKTMPDNELILFADNRLGGVPPSSALAEINVYNPTGNAVTDDKLIQTITLPQGQKVRNFCIYDPTVPIWKCNDDMGTGNGMNVLDVVFFRPNSEPFIVMDGNAALTYPEAFIVVQSSIGDKCRIIRVSSTGQINVEPYTTLRDNGCSVIKLPVT